MRILVVGTGGVGSAFAGIAREARVSYLDMALSLSQPHPERPYEETHVKLGDEQFEQSSKWEEAALRREARRARLAARHPRARAVGAGDIHQLVDFLATPSSYNRD